MTYLKTISAKLFGGLAAIALMTASAAAQDSAPKETAKPLTKLAQLQLKADALNAARASQVSLNPTPAVQQRRIVREAVPVQSKSVQTLNQGRIYTSHDYTNDAMRVYKTHDHVSARYIPNHFQATAK